MSLDLPRRLATRPTSREAGTQSPRITATGVMVNRRASSIGVRNSPSRWRLHLRTEKLDEVDAGAEFG